MVWLMIFASTRALGHILQRLLEVLAVDMRGAGLGIPKRLDQDVDGRVFHAARPVEPQLPGSALVAVVNGSTKPGQRFVQSGFVSNLTTMKIITVSC